MAAKDGTEAERNPRYKRIGKASAKAIKNTLAGTALEDPLHAGRADRPRRSSRRLNTSDPSHNVAET
jgi:hypothetical protein